MYIVRRLLIFLFLSLLNSISFAQDEHPEVRRTRGFQDYKKQKQLIEKDRDKGLALHLETLEIEKREYNEALEEYRKQKKKEKPLEYTSAYQENIRDRHEEAAKAQQDLETFRYDKKIEKKQLEQAHLNKMEELGLPEDRPRFDVKKRTLYGAASPFGKSKVIGGSSAPDFSSGGGSNSFPPPPPASSFDEFPAPPTFPSDDGFDLPPPPPPPPMPFDDGMGMNSPTFDEFPPPPPPPVDDFQF